MNRGPGTRPVLASVAFHLVVLVPMVMYTSAPAPVEFDTIRITLVSAPQPVEATEPVPPQLEPEPEPVVEEPVPEPVVEPPRPEPPQRPPPQRVERPTPRPTTPPPATPPAEPTPGAAGLNIQTEGIEFPFPAYLNNVILQVHRYFRWTEGTNPRGTIYFEIQSDGSVRNIRMVRPSGNIRFDFAVQGAVETAGNRGEFGPLPDGFVASSLPVQIEVEPPR
jgi:outer membrane biosynthesis protein TonB